MVLRGPEKGAVEDRPAEPQVEIVLPREADPAVQLGADARRAVVEIGEMRLGERRVALGAIRDVIPGVRGAAST